MLCKTFILRLVHPESQLAFFMRAVRNRLNARFRTLEWQLKQADASYSAWIKMREQTINKTIPKLSFQPLVSFLIPKPEFLEQLPRLVQSLKAQVYPNWELIIATEETSPTDITALDNRIKYADVGIGDYLSLASQASGNFVVCARAGDQFSALFLTRCLAKANQYPGARIIYSDNDWINNNGIHTEPFFKPETYSPEMLFSINYLSRALLQREMVLTVGKHLLNGIEPDVQEWELILNSMSISPEPIHVADVLVHQNPNPNEKAQMQTSLMLEHYLNQIGMDQPRATPTTDGWRITWHNEQPLVSIVIPSKNNHLVFKHCLDSIFKLTNYKNYELIIVDNNSTDENLLAFYEEMRENNKIKIVEYNEPFNYSHAINLGAATAKGDLLLFLNNDIQVLNKDWLNELARWALIPEIGIVGAKLLYPNGRIQHAGVVLGLEGFVDHLYMNAPQDYCGLIGSVNWYRNVSAVTGACQMMRRKVFDELGGYDENYRLIFSDVDICLKATQKNYRIVYTPFAQLTHYHGLSRERKDPTKDLALGFKHLTSSFDGNDPFFSPNLTYTYIPCCQIKPESGDDRMIRMRESQNIFQRWTDT